STWSATASASSTPTYTLAFTTTFTPTRTPTLFPTATGTATSTDSATPTSTGSPTASATPTPIVSGTGTVAILYPNPDMGPGPVTLLMALSSSGEVRAKVFTTAFRKVAEAFFPQVPSGTVKLQLNLTDKSGVPLAEGLYYVSVEGPGQKQILKLLLLR
ncbi:MAG TPA: hypothetical protein VJ873_04535, partial [bacterium]|nr:hypothetical protein [bacterium]